MTHRRQSIREAVTTALIGATGSPGPVTYATAAGARVYETRLEHWLQRELPGITVFSDSETVEQDSSKSSPRRLIRNLQLAIEVATLATDNTDDALDSLAAEIEAVMDADLYFGLAYVMDSVLVSSDTTLSMQGNRIFGLLRMVYTVTYETENPVTTGVELDDFSTAAVTYQVNNSTDVEDTDQAHDLVEDLET